MKRPDRRGARSGREAGRSGEQSSQVDRPAALVILSILLLSFSAISCSNRQPINEFWNYAWGSTYSAIYADSADLKYRLGGLDFSFKADPLRIEYFDAQYGLGYGHLTLDFTPDGRLWHGAVRTKIIDSITVDSSLQALFKRFGQPTGKRTIRGDQGTIVWWQTALWMDRDFYANGLAPEISPAEIRAVDVLHRGCLAECPIYSVRFLSSGEAYLWGIQGTPYLGGFQGRIDSATFAELAAVAATPAMLALQDYYGYLGLNLSRREARVDYGNFDRDFASVEGSAPPVLEAFLDRLDSAAAQITWGQIVSWDSVRIMDQPKIGLDSLAYLGATSGRP